MGRTILNDASIDWAVKFIIKFSDGDLFPKVMEDSAEMRQFIEMCFDPNSWLLFFALKKVTTPGGCL